MDDLPRQQARARRRRMALAGTATFVVALCLFTAVFLGLLGSTWQAGAAAWSTAAVCTSLELYRLGRNKP